LRDADANLVSREAPLRLDGEDRRARAKLRRNALCLVASGDRNDRELIPFFGCKYGRVAWACIARDLHRDESDTRELQRVTAAEVRSKRRERDDEGFSEAILSGAE